MTTEQDVRAMTKPKKVAYLKAHGWTRTESDDSQTWVSPDGREAGTLAYLIRYRRRDRRRPAAVAGRGGDRAADAHRRRADRAERQ